MPSCAFLCVYFLSLVSFSAVLHLGMTEELVGAPMSNSQTGATFKQLVDGNRVHFHAGQPAPSSEPAASRTGVPLFLKCIYFAVMLSLLVFNLLLITFSFLTKFIIYNFQIRRFFRAGRRSVQSTLDDERFYPNFPLLERVTTCSVRASQRAAYLRHCSLVLHHRR